MNMMVVGTGYVGLVQGACMAHLGHRVACVDIDEDKIKALRRAMVPFFEPGLGELIQEGLENGRLSFHASQREAVDTMGDVEISFVCVQTPRRSDGSCDLSAVKAVCRELGSVMSKTLCVIKSTVPPGTRTQIREWLGNDEIGIASNPEFLREGKSVNDFFHPDRILIGAESEEDAELLKSAYIVIEAPVFIMSVESAQFSKYAANTMLAARLSFMNEFALIADKIGADIKDIESAVGADPRIGSDFLRAGAGFGGSCFPKDVLALADVAEQEGVESLLIAPIIEANNRQPYQFIKKIEDQLGDLSEKRIAVWGLAFNRDTDDVRESSAMIIVKELVNRGAKVTVYDPEAMENAKLELFDDVVYGDSMMKALNGVHALAVLTEWPQFATADWKEVKEKILSMHLFDGKNFLPREELEEMGFEVHGMGLCAKHQRRPRAS